MKPDSQDLIRLGRRAVLASAGAYLLAPSSGARAQVFHTCVIGKDGWLFPKWDDVRFSIPANVLAVTKIINLAIGLLHDGKVQVALSLTPAKSRVYREFLPDDCRMSAVAERRYRLAYDALRPSGAIMFDQAAFFAAVRAARPDALLYFKADTHWVAVGAAAAAAEMARQITLAGVLPPSPRPGDKLGDPRPVVQQHNDLALLLPKQEQEKYPYQTYYLREPVHPGGEDDLLDDDDPDTVVIGNSFMQPGYGYAAILSSELNRPVALAWKVHQFSPYWSLLNFLRSDGFKRRRPRVIVWNFQEADMETPPTDDGAWGPTAMSASQFLADLRTLVAA